MIGDHNSGGKLNLTVDSKRRILKRQLLDLATALLSSSIGLSPLHTNFHRMRHQLTEPEAIGDLLGQVGIAADSLELITVGASSEAWRVEAGEETFVLRLFSPSRGHKPTYEFEYGLRSRLRRSTKLVPEPVTTDRDFAPAVNDQFGDWILDRFVDGRFLKRGEPLPDSALARLGEVLSVLHIEESTGYGAPENTREGCFGTGESYVDGLCQRFPDLWPFRGPDLGQHPVSDLAPHLTAPLEKLAETVLELPRPDQPVPTHFDLHNEQLILDSGELAAVIDFGASIVAAPVWDFASFTYFHSVGRAQVLLKLYSPDAAMAEELLTKARLLAILVGVHHVRRSFQIDRPARRKFALNRIESLLQAH